MTHAYSELYLSDAKSCLADMFDYLINDCSLESDWIASLFITTGYAHKFETGNPAILSGLSGIELGKAIIKKAYNKKEVLDESDEVYENLRKAFVFESEKNKLTYDMEIEPIYLVGKFGVKTDGEMKKTERDAYWYKGKFRLTPPKECGIKEFGKTGISVFCRNIDS